MGFGNIACVTALGCLLALPALAQAPAPAPSQAPTQTPEQQRQEEIVAAWQAAGKAATRGPAEIKLVDQATLALPDGDAFVPGVETRRVMKALGNGRNPHTIGLIAGKGGPRWMIIIDWVDEGYVRDGDAKEWQPDEMLKNLRDGTESGNTERVALGMKPLGVIGWVEPPTYDVTTHRLIWSMAAEERGAPADAPHLINYNTYALGRNGYFELLLIDDSAHIEADKPIVRDLLGALKFQAGKRYQDFNGSTDKVAAYGLAALIGVVAVKKLGLLAGAGFFLVKIWKVGVLALAGVAAAARRFFRRAR